MATDKNTESTVSQSDKSAASLSAYILRARQVKTTILAPDRVPAAKQENYDSNVTTSHFFRLPTELRNRIYSLVLTGFNIHVSGEAPDDNDQKLSLERILTRTACKRRDSHDHTAAKKTQTSKKKRNPKHQHNISSFALRHGKCKVGTQNQFNLALLETSREIHSEAALIFYQENTFSFDNIVNFEAFLEFLVPAQVQAVQHIIIAHDFFKSNAAFEKRLAMKLGSLKTLTIFVDDDLRSASYSSGSRVTPKTATECLLRFQRISIESAKVAAHRMSLEWMENIEALLEKEWVVEGPKKKVKAQTKTKKPAEAVFKMRTRSAGEAS